MAERPKAAVLKTARRKSRGFESLPLRHLWAALGLAAGCAAAPDVRDELAALRARVERLEARPSAPEPGSERPDAPPLLRRPHGDDPFVVCHGPEHAADAQRVQGWMQAALAAFREEFADHDVHAALTRIDCRVWLHPAPDDDARPGYAHTGSGTRDGRYYADLHLLSPSAHPAGGSTVVGEPYDDAYHRKTLVHEYAHVLLDRLVRAKPSGWKLYTAPVWFQEGYPEYLSLVCSTQHSRAVTLAKYVADAKAAPDRTGPDLEGPQPYVDGATILLFLHERYGRTRVQALLTSRAATFADALAEVLGTDAATLRTEWWAWLAAR